MSGEVKRFAGARKSKGKTLSSLSFIFFLFFIEVEFCFSTGPEGPVSSADSYCCFSAFVIVIDRLLLLFAFACFLFFIVFVGGGEIFR